MNNQPTDPSQESIISLETLPPDTQVTITVSTDVYIRLQQLLLEGLPWKDLEHLQTVLKAVHDKSAVKEDPLIYHAETILYLLSLVEQSAKSSGKIKQAKFDLTAGKLVPDSTP